MRDVDATLADALGDQAAISKLTVSQVCQAIKTEYDTWTRRRLDDVLDYLFLDASFFRMHPGSPAEPILAAWGITTAGKVKCLCRFGWFRSTKQLVKASTRIMGCCLRHVRQV